ncbi:MAG TPA: hypothetical protein VFQ85_15255 [Mycobacteriales bacterium]|jgi:hypothetical protein|nr:hypothetical protein [Mycobacteriales bacterium]
MQARTLRLRREALHELTSEELGSILRAGAVGSTPTDTLTTSIVVGPLTLDTRCATSVG